MMMLWKKSQWGCPLAAQKQADENTGMSTDESLPGLSLRACAGGNPMSTSSPKALTSHPLGLGVREMASELGGRRTRGAETRGRIPLPELMVLLLVR